MAALVLALCAGLGTSSAAHAVAAETVKYYQVEAGYAGQPENLSEIALRFLGEAGRAGDILDLNVGREQPDGAALEDAGKLHKGWYLVLPWDAIGDAVHLGALPTTPPKSATTPPKSAPKPTSTGTTRPKATSSSGLGACAAGTNVSRANWAPLRMAPDQAWARTKGDGVIVAIVDSGVDATLPELTGKVAVGADIVSGSGRGNTDCLGSGTAMAGIIVAQSDQGSSFGGLAPGANVLPIRVVTTTPHAPSADQTSAIAVAVSAGATVVALGSYVDITDPLVAQAVTEAVDHNVVVVAGAPITTSAPAGPAPSGLLRVAGVGVDDGRAEDYRTGEVDLTAPGMGITVLGISGIGDQGGSGTNLAVAFVAAETALVRAAYPHLTAAQVVHRLEATADKLGDPVPNATYGWGIINPSAAVNETLAEEQPTVQPSPVAAGGGGGSSSSTGSTIALMLVIALCLVAVAAFVFRVRRVVLARAGKTPAIDEAELGPPGGGDGPSDPWRDVATGEDTAQLADREAWSREGWGAMGARREGADGGAASAAGPAPIGPAAPAAGEPGRRTPGADREQR